MQSRCSGIDPGGASGSVSEIQASGGVPTASEIAIGWDFELGVSNYPQYLGDLDGIVEEYFEEMDSECVDTLGKVPLDDAAKARFCDLGGVDAVCGDSVVVEVRQEEGRDGSKRRFTQSFKLPNNISPDTVTSTLSAEGILTISAPLPGN